MLIEVKLKELIFYINKNLNINFLNLQIGFEFFLIFANVLIYYKNQNDN